MTIDLTDNAPRVSYTVSTSTTSFAVPFEFFDDADLVVVVGGTTKTLTTHYTVSGGNGATGTVTMTSGNAVSSGTVIIFRDIDFKRTTDFPTSGAFPIATLNTELDRNIALFDDLQDRIDRSVRLNDNDDAASMVLPLKASRKGTVLGFNATTGAAEAGPTIANVNSLADITTNINTVAGISSNVTTVAGISSNVTTVAGISSAVSSVAGVASLITSDFVSDLNTLATSAIVEDLNILATSDIVSDLNTLATTDIVSDLNTLATADIVSDLNTLATSDIVSDLNQLATSDFVSDLNAIEAIKANVTSVAGVASNVTTVAGISSNVTTVAGVSSNVSTVASNISSVTSVASNISNVTTVANQLQSSSPTFTGTISAGGLNIDSNGSVLNDISLTFQQTEAQSNAGTLPQVVLKSKTNGAEGVIQANQNGTLNLIGKDSGLGDYGNVDVFVQDGDASNLTRVVSFGILEHDFFKRLHLALDGTSIKFGNDGEVTITHVHDTGLLLNSTSQLQFGDSGTYIHQSADGVLDLVSDTEIEINATTIDMNGAVDISGNATFGGNIVKTAGSGTFTIETSGSSSVNLNASSSMKFTVGNSDSHQFVNGSDTVLVIDSSGKTGMNVTSPSGILHVKTPTGTSGSNNTVKGLVVQEGGFSTANILEIQDSVGGEYMVVDGSGNVAIGSSNPQNLLHLEASAGARMRFVDTGTQAYTLGNSGTSLTINNESQSTTPFIIASDGETTISRADTGNVLKGLSTNNNTRSRIELSGKDPSGNLVTLIAGGEGDFGGMVFTNTNHKLGFATNNASPQMVLDTNGNVLVGTTTTGIGADAGTELTVSDSTEASITIRSGTSNHGNIYFSDATSGTDEYVGIIRYNHASNYMMFQTANQERMRISNTGVITKPFQPAFSAFRDSSSVEGLTGTIVFNNTRSNVGSHYNTSTGKFTAPVTGNYQFNLVALGATSGGAALNGEAVFATLYHETDNANLARSYVSGQTGYPNLSFSTTQPLDANDVVRIDIGGAGVYSDGSDIWLLFSGFLIG